MGGMKTLYRYYRALMEQIDDIMKALTSGIISLDSTISIMDIHPEDDTKFRKLTILFHLIDTLLELLHRKNITGIILSEEAYEFIHCYLYQKSRIILLASGNKKLQDTS